MTMLTTLSQVSVVAVHSHLCSQVRDLLLHQHAVCHKRAPTSPEVCLFVCSSHQVLKPSSSSALSTSPPLPWSPLWGQGLASSYQRQWRWNLSHSCHTLSLRVMVMNLRDLSELWFWTQAFLCQSEAETQTVAVTVLQVTIKKRFTIFKILRGISYCQPWQGLATGTLLYVVFFEVIEKERLKGTTGMVQVMLLYWETTPPQEHNHTGHLCLAGLLLHAWHGGGGTLLRGGAGLSNTLLRAGPSHIQQHLQASFNHMFARESHNITWVAM